MPWINRLFNQTAVDVGVNPYIPLDYVSAIFYPCLNPEAGLVKLSC